MNRYSIGQAIAGWRVCDKAMTPKKTSIERTNLLVLWGSSPTESLQRASAWISERRRDRPLKTIVIDPRVTKVAEVADYHLRLRPGTDTALALGWANVIVNEGLYDKEFVQKWTLGFDKLVERLKEYPPARVAEITGLTVEQITRFSQIIRRHQAGLDHRRPGAGPDRSERDPGRTGLRHLPGFDRQYRYPGRQRDAGHRT